MPSRRFVVLLAIFGAAMLRAEEKPPDGVEFFEKKIRPLLVKHCYECHGPDAKKPGGGLRLDSRDGVLKGGGSGVVVVPSDPEKSLLLKAVRRTGELKMPPKSKLSADEVNDLEAWVKMGVPDPRTGIVLKPAEPTRGRDLWSLKPVRDPPVPDTKDSWALNAIDQFILTKLDDKRLHPAPTADRRTLIRRATYDLTGLPPTPEEVEAFLADDSPNAFAKVIDRLLASPAYGERWGRHWLDVVRYADTAGDNSDYPIPQMYRYRNLVIDSINANMPYDEFVRRQLAGDLLPAANDADRHEKLIATGYLANARRFGSYDDLGNGLPYPWYLTYEDTIDNLGRTFLGLTINCARCHDHKFDPLTQQDYYALYGFFQSTRYPWPGIELDKVQRDVVPLVPAEQVTAYETSRREKLAGFDARVKELQAEKAAVDKFAKAMGYFSFLPGAVLSPRADKLVESIKAARKAKEDFEKQSLPFPTAYAVADRPVTGKRKVGNACVQIKGVPERLGPEVPRRFPIILGGQSLPPETKSSGRLELARWIVRRENPLTARVIVNRVWQYHFGRGIVPTPSDFGNQGQPPTHPELLDYLASRFVEGGWSLKAMHRRIMLSRAYQMSSADDPANAKLDADNEFLWRFPRKRLDAESIRDTMLAVGGSLDRSPGGPHPFPAMTTWDFTQHKPFKAVYETDRRSVYLMTQRIQRHPFLALFDGADTNASTATRVTSTTPLQALYLMNDPFVHTQARKLTERLMAECPDDSGRIERAYALLFGRPPTSEEAAGARDYLGRVSEKLRSAGEPKVRVSAKAWESLARGLMLSNEFVYVD